MQLPRDTIGTRARRGLVLCTLAIAAAIVMTWPLATGLNRLGRTANSGDARVSVWNVAWVAHALLTDPSDLFDANIFHPHRNTLAFSEANLAAGVIGLPAWWLTRNGETAHNVVVLFTFAASAVTMWLFARRLTGDGWAASTSAVLFAFCPFLFSHTAHIQLLMAAGLPLSLLMIHRVADAPSRRAGVALGVALAAQALGCAYYGIFAGFMVAYVTLFLAWSRGLWRSPRYWTAVAIGAFLSMLLVTPAFAHYLRLQDETGFGRSLDDAAPYSAYLRSYLASAAHAHNWLLPIIKDWNHEVLFPGFLAILLGATGVAAIARGRDTSASSPALSGDREAVMLYGSLGLLAFWASLGPRAGLYTVLFKTVPVFSLLRAPGRTGIIVTLVLALFAAFGVRAIASVASTFRWKWNAARSLPPDQLPPKLRRSAEALRAKAEGGSHTRATRSSPAIAIACCALALLELNGVPIDWREARPISPVYDVLAGMPRGAVAEFPFYERRIDFHIHTIYMVNSTRHWKPLLNGYSDYIPPDFRELAVVLASFPSRESFEAMKQRRTRYIVIHRDLYGAQTAPLIEARLQAFMPYLRAVTADDRVQIYEIVAWPRAASP
jgi:hypothetical protein